MISSLQVICPTSVPTPCDHAHLSLSRPSAHSDFSPQSLACVTVPKPWCSTYQRGEMFSCRWTTSGQQPAAQSTPRRSRLRRHRRILLSCSHSTSTTIPQIQGYWYPVLRVSIWLERFDRWLQGGDDVHYAREPAVREEMTVARTEPSPA